MTRRRRTTSRPGPAPVPDQSRRSLIAPGATPEEAAAIVAALERFLADTTPRPLPASRPRPVGWLRAALLEGVRRGDRRPGAWGDPHP